MGIYHSMTPLTSGRRCVLLASFTVDRNQQEMAHIQAETLLRGHDTARLTDSRSEQTNVAQYTTFSFCLCVWRYSSLSLYHNCDSTMIRLRYDDTTMHSITTEVIKVMICIRFDCDTTTTRLRRKIDVFIFCSRWITSHRSRRMRYVIVGS